MEITGRAFKYGETSGHDIDEEYIAEEHIFKSSDYLNKQLHDAYENGKFNTKFIKLIRKVHLLIVEITTDNWDQEKIKKYVKILSSKESFSTPKASSGIYAYSYPHVIIIRKNLNKEEKRLNKL